MRPPTPHIFELSPQSLAERLTDLKMAPYRAKQVLQWVYERYVIDPGQMTNLAKWERERIGQTLDFQTGDVVRDLRATDGTHKLLIRWRSGHEIGEVVESDTAAGALSALHVLPDHGRMHKPDRETECVMIPAAERRTACISSQVGCPVGCGFCASGLGGLDGNLTAGRIVEQVWVLARDVAAHEEGGRVTNVVFMGMGEPLANYQAVVDAVRILNAPWALGVSGRKITISTVGLPAAIRRLADEELSVTLAISLHAPNDVLRRQLIPWAEFTSIEDLMAAGQYYFERTGREVTLEYILLGGVNDRPQHARELAEVAQTLRANVNLIRYNEVVGLPFERPGSEDVLEFQRILKNSRVNTHIRASRGRDIAAACGQLRHEHRATV